MARARAAAQQAHGPRTEVDRFARPSPPRAYAWLVGWDERGKCERKKKDRQRFVDTLCRIEPSIAIAGRLARHFLGLIHRRDGAGFDGWLARAHSCGIPELRRFAAGLKADLLAVRAAFESGWSSGQGRGAGPID
jgi:transposase